MDQITKTYRDKKSQGIIIQTFDYIITMGGLKPQRSKTKANWQKHYNQPRLKKQLYSQNQNKLRRKAPVTSRAVANTQQKNNEDHEKICKTPRREGNTCPGMNFDNKMTPWRRWAMRLIGIVKRQPGEYSRRGSTWTCLWRWGWGGPASHQVKWKAPKPISIVHLCRSFYYSSSKHITLRQT